MTIAVSKLKAEMAKKCLSALIIPTADSHNSEYVPKCFECRGFVTDFTGSAGTCVVFADQSKFREAAKSGAAGGSDGLLWTDARYYLEAEESLAKEFQLMKDGSEGVLSFPDWLEATSEAVQVSDAREGPLKVGIDPFCCTVNLFEEYREKFCVVPTDESIPLKVMQECGVDTSLPKTKVFSHPEEFSGKSSQEKIEAVCDAVKKVSCDAVFLSALDDIAWLMNLRGTDIQHNPVFYSYCIVDVATKKATLFTDNPMDADTKELLVENGVTCAPYEAWKTEVTRDEVKTKKVSIDPLQVSFGVLKLLEDAGVRVKRTKGIVQHLKAVKNAVEVTGMTNAHVRDGCALTRFFAWLEEKVIVEEKRLTEVEAADELEDLRAVEANYFGLSFGTIPGSGPNGAIVHYHPTRENARVIQPDDIFLCDSGGQYFDGTTDVTRTVCFGTAPNPEVVERYTLVLKGHLAVARAVWPKGTTGHRLDTLARQFLWENGLNYGHGTGHGVGTFLNVHEGPQSIRQFAKIAEAALDEGMVTSNEPGFYKKDHYGIRIENLETVVRAKTKFGDENGAYLTFRTLTMAPYCHPLIDKKLLTAQEIEQVNKYHEKVFQVLEPMLITHNDERAMKYLKVHTSPL